MTDIPEDVMKAARDAASRIYPAEDDGRTYLTKDDVEEIARAIMDERERSQWQPIVEDGRLCTMDQFASALFEEFDDVFVRSDAINEWLYGDWDAALSYLKEETREKLSASNAEAS